MKAISQGKSYCFVTFLIVQHKKIQFMQTETGNIKQICIRRKLHSVR